MEQFQKGDVVQLNSGSRNMDVTEVDEGAGAVKCIWMDNNTKYEEEFDAAVLKKPLQIKNSYHRE